MNPSRWNLRLSPLQWGLVISLAAHLLLFALHSGSGAAPARAFGNAPLSVVLVNRASPTPPSHPTALAQVDLDAGGGARSGMAATPLPAARRSAAGDAAAQTEQQAQASEQPQREVLSAERSQVVTLRTTPRNDDAQAAAQAPTTQQQREMLDLLGAIERRVELRDAGPRRRVVGPSTRSVPYALYYDRMREKIERLGTLDFPQRDGRKLYGHLVMAMTVDASGRVLRADVVHGSGDGQLDRMARAIVEGAQPYGRFSPAMLHDADQIIVVAGFDFTREGGINADLRATPPASPTPAAPPAAAR